jgi:hypothetical protein
LNGLCVDSCSSKTSEIAGGPLEAAASLQKVSTYAGSFQAAHSALMPNLEILLLYHPCVPFTVT